MRAGHAPIGMHHFPASDQDPADYSRVMVGAADVWVGLISLNYGSPVRGGGDVSYTELEFETATDLGRPRLVFLVDDDGLPSGQDVERQRAFRRRLQGAV
jgi:hypothetical protein